jgi:foldase protein PrsA
VFKPIRFISALGAVFFATVGLAACGGGVPSGSVAQVGETPITKATFEHWINIAASSSASATPGSTAKPVIPVPPDYTACIAHLEATAPKPAKGQSKPTAAELKTECEQQYTSLKQETLGYLIQSNWLLGVAKEQGVSVSDHEVEKEFDTEKKAQFPQESKFNAFLAKTGYTVSDLLGRIKVQMLSTRIEQKITKNAKKPVTEAEATKYYNEHKSEYGQPEKANLELVLTKTEANAKKAKEEIESGQSFASVAKHMSIDPVSKANGGKLTGISKGEEEKALDEAIFSAKLNTLSGPIKTPFGYYIFLVQKRTPGTQQSLAQVKESIKQQIGALQEQQALSKFSKSLESNWKAKTECLAEYVVQNCKEYKAPKTTLPTTTTPQTGTTVTATASK